MSLTFSIIFGLFSGVVWGFCRNMWKKASIIVLFSLIVIYLILMTVGGDAEVFTSWNWIESLVQIVSMLFGICAGNAMAEEFK